MKKWAAFLSLTFLCSCGYHYKPSDPSYMDAVSITVPYIVGDTDGIFNNELVYRLSSSGHFQCSQSGGTYILQAKLLADSQSRIGFRYDRDNVSGTLEKNLLGVESRRSVSAEIALIDTRSGKTVIGPFDVSADVEYDYIDPGSPRDLIFDPSSGPSQSIIQFSLGQLDSYEGSYDDTSKLLFRRLSEKITIGILNKLSDSK